jgi:carboxymethylenebutenolidase
VLRFRLPTPHPRPIFGGATDARDLRLTSADGTRFMAYAARATSPTGAGMIVIPDVRGLHQYLQGAGAAIREAGVDAVRHRLSSRAPRPATTGATSSTS